MSLWRVPDAQTRELMLEFYRRLMTGTGAAQALREAQQALKDRYPSPYYWGAFIYQGDPGVTVHPHGRGRVETAAASAPRSSEEPGAEPPLDVVSLCSWLPNPVWDKVLEMAKPVSKNNVPSWRWHDIVPHPAQAGNQEINLLELGVESPAEADPTRLSPHAIKVFDRDNRSLLRRAVEEYFDSDTHSRAVSLVEDCVRNGKPFCLYLSEPTLSALVVPRVSPEFSGSDREEMATVLRDGDRRFQSELSQLSIAAPVIALTNPYDPQPAATIPKLDLTVSQRPAVVSQLLDHARAVVLLLGTPSVSTLGDLRAIAARASGQYHPGTVRGGGRAAFRSRGHRSRRCDARAVSGRTRRMAGPHCHVSARRAVPPSRRLCASREATRVDGRSRPARPAGYLGP